MRCFRSVRVVLLYYYCAISVVFAVADCSKDQRVSMACLEAGH